MGESVPSKKWRARIDSGRMTHSECRAWCKTVIPTALGEERSPYAPTSRLTQAEAVALRGAMRRSGGMELETEHAEKGLRWIRTYHADKFPEWVTSDFARFTFQGDGYDITAERRREGTYYGSSHYVPVWRIHGTRGQWLDYYAAAWQSGKTGPRVVRQWDAVPADAQLDAEISAGFRDQYGDRI